MNEDIEWLTIAQTAKRLGLIERQARRWAAKLPAEGRRQEEIGNGRTRAVIRLDLLTALVSGQVTGQVSGQVSGQPAETELGAEAPHADLLRPLGEAPERGEHPASELSFAVPLNLAMTAQRDALERVIAEQAARIFDLQAALEHERGQAKQLTEALAREQTLRLLSVPEMPPDTPPNDGGAGASAEPGLEPPTEPILGRIRAFWKRHWY